MGVCLLPGPFEKSSLEQIEGYMANKPQNVEAKVAKASILFRQGNYKDALVEYNWAYMKDRTCMEAKIGILKIKALQGMVYTSLESLSSDSYLERGVLFGQTGMCTEAITEFDKQLTNQPDDHFTRKEKIRVLQKTDLHAEGLSELKFLKQSGVKDIELRIFKANLCLKAGRYVSAERICNEVLVLFPDCQEIVEILFALLMKQERYVDALKLCEKQTKYFPNDFNLLYIQARYQCYLGQKAAADGLYEAIVGVTRDVLSKDGSNAEASLLQVRALRFLWRFPEAIEELDRFLEMSPGHSQVLITKADVLIYLNRMEEAREILFQVGDPVAKKYLFKCVKIHSDLTSEIEKLNFEYGRAKCFLLIEPTSRRLIIYTGEVEGAVDAVVRKINGVYYVNIAHAQEPLRTKIAKKLSQG